jgi:hypothetical protein
MLSWCADPWLTALWALLRVWRRFAVTTGFAVLKYGMNAGTITAWQKNE